MRFRTDKVNLTETLGVTTNDGSEAWLEVTVGTTEGFISDLQGWRGDWPADDADEARRGQPKDPGGRRGNVMLLDRVVAWNLDGEDGTVLPLTRAITVDSPSVKKRAKAENISADEAVFEEKVDVIRQLPIEIFLELANRMTNTKPLTARAEGF